MNDVNLYTDKNLKGKKERKNLDGQNTNINNKDNKNYKKKIIFISSISFGCLIIILAVVLSSIYKPWLKHEKIECECTPSFTDDPIVVENYEINYNDFKNELIFKTKVNDIRRLSIEQNSYEDMVIDGIQAQTKSFRKTKYDIYIISEKNVDDENKKCYNKIYTASISLVSQCLSLKNEDCELKELVDLSNNDKTNLRSLKEVTDLKDIPVPLCLFNLTDTNIITSISCPGSLSQNIKNEILSDLYYFRPIAKASTSQKHEMEITIEDDIKTIRKQSKGLCDINNELSSSCNLDMNVTKDSQGNLLSFNETSSTDITSDSNNLFKKNNILKLVDETSKINNLNPEKYKSILNDLLLKLYPYLKYEENNSVNKMLKQTNSKIIIDRLSKRYLTENDDIYKKYLTKEENLFFKDLYGTKVSLNLKIDSGINVETMKISSNLKFNEKENVLYNKVQFSNLNKILKKLKNLSNTGNLIALQLYETIKNKLDNLPNEISIQVSNLNSLIIYKDLTEIFDSSLSLNNLQILPIDIIEDSNILFNKINLTLNQIDNENRDFKNYSNILENNINNYLGKSYDLMNNIFNNLTHLKNLLNSPKNKFTEISTIYLNNTSTSYVNTIQEIKKIFKDYIDEKLNYINNTIEMSLNDFDTHYLESIKKHKNIVNNLYTKLEKKSLKIENAETEDYEQILNNLNNSNDYTDIIANKIKNETRKIFNSNNNYILSNNDINKYNNDLEESIKIADSLDNDEIVDKLFDKIFINFIDNFTNILKYMDKIKEGKFPLVDDVLNDLFSLTTKNNMKNKISECSVNIINVLNRENNHYINLVKENVNKFINENLGSLNNIIIDLNMLLSNESLEDISYSYQYAFKGSVNAILNDINYYSLLVQKYYNAYNNNISFALANIKDSSEFKVISYEKKINQSYFNNYNILKSNLGKLKTYITTQLYDDFLDEYKNIIVKLKETLLSIKNNKITDLYPGIKQFNFYNKHTNILDELNNRIDRYFSSELYNKNYLLELNKFNTNATKLIDNIINFMDTQHSILSKLKTIEKDTEIGNDYYICFDMTCSGKYASYKYCAKFYYDQYIYETDFSIYSQGNFKSLEKFNDISSTLNEKSNFYNSKLNIEKDSLLNIEKEVIDKNMTKDYLSPIESEINLILSQKYGEEIVKSTYNYYKNDIETKIEDILTDINSKWNDSFNILEKEINNNISNFKYSIEEFGIMSNIYQSIISKDIYKDYFDSIINLQKKEFNYTISYYYNYLLKLVNSKITYILNNIPTNQMKLNNIIDLRKQEINNELNKIFKKINDSKNEVLNIDNQINILNVEKLDFFGMNSTLTNNIILISNYLSDKSEEIARIDNNKSHNEYTIASRYYLENSEFGKQINSFYEEIFELFIELNKEKFKELINNNWIIDPDDIIHRLNTSLYNSNQEIYKDLLIIIDNYTLEMEKEINKYYTKESMIERINALYNNGIKVFDSNKMNNFKNNLYGILDLIYEHFYNESKRINNTAVSYNSDFSKINNTVKNYKQRILNETNIIYTNVIKDFRDNMMNNVYNEYIEKGLNEFVTKCKEYTKDFKEYYLLNSSYNLEEITNNLIGELTNDYKQFIKKQIDYKYETKLKYTFDLDELEDFLDYEVDYEYNLLLLPILKKKAIYKPGDTGYTEYDFNDNIKNNINSKFNTAMNNISTIFLSIKGDNYQVNISNWENLDYSNINTKLSNIKTNFEKFIDSEKNNENNLINNSIKNIIKSNFNILFNNILSSSGNEYFERAIKFNEYFRINDLYDYLNYSLIQTSEYYLRELDINENNTLPKELKKIYNFNNIELLIQKNKNYLLDLLNKKIEELINDSKDHLITNYLSYMKDDIFITLGFSKDIREMINNNFNNSSTDIEKDYSATLKTYLNDNFVVPYTNIINEKTNLITDYINEKRNLIKEHLDNYLTLESEIILDEINLQINKILDLINEYNSNFNIFKMPDEFIQFLNDYGTNNIKPIYEEFKTKIDKLSNTQIISNFEKNVNNYQNSFNLDEFLNISNTTFLNIKNNYIDNMTININNYYSNYSYNFEKEVVKENNEKIINIEETFQKLLKKYDNAKIFIEALKEFNDYDKTIIKNINNLNIAYKESQN